jgi:hypothetical protein
VNPFRTGRMITALESIAVSLKELVVIERERTPASRPIKKAEITVASVADWNDRWQHEHPVPDAEEGEE